MKKYVFILAMMLSFNAYAANTCGDNLNKNCWDCGATDKDLCTAVLTDEKLTITGSGKMAKYGYDSDLEYDFPPWPKTITEVNISGIKEIQQGAFYEFDNLQKVIIGEGVEKIHWYTFTGCDNLSEVTLPDTLIAIGNFSFGGNPKLKSFTIPEAFFSPETGKGRIWEFVFLNTDLEAFYCPEKYINECQTALKTSQRTEMSDEKINQILKTYEKYNNEYLYDGKFYASPNDIIGNHYIQKRIYTIDEANLVTKSTGNSVKIRYR